MKLTGTARLAYGADTRGVMRSMHGLVPIVLLVLVAVSSTPVQAQEGAGMPRALAPDGQLPLEGTAWRLRAYVYRGIERDVGPEVAAWLRLSDSRLLGSGGCTALRGTYAVIGSALKVGPGKIRQPRCGEQTTIVQLAMVEALKAAASYGLLASNEPRGTELVIRDVWGTGLLRFSADDAGPLTGEEWRLTTFSVGDERTDAHPDQPAVMSFQPQRQSPARRRSDGDVVASTGCNGIIGAYFRNADVISFGPLELTDAPCVGQVGVQQQAMIAVLDATSSILALPPDRLIITSSESGDSLEFVRASTLEGTTWLLSSMARGKNPSTTVTLLLDGGRAGGEGPCGPYSGGYTTDGVFITFTDVSGAGDADCDERGPERALLTALRRAVRLDRAGDDLTLLDAGGTRTARFSSPGTP